jgi:hypothetical protein
MWRLNSTGAEVAPAGRSLSGDPHGGEAPPAHVSLLLLVGQLLVMAQGGFAIAIGVNLLRGAQTLDDVSAGFRQSVLSAGAVTATAVLGIVIGALVMFAGLRVRRLTLVGRVPLALAELLLLLISAVAIAAGGADLSIVSVAVLAFAGSPLLPGAALLSVEAIAIYALLIHPFIDEAIRRWRAARVRVPVRVHLTPQPSEKPGTVRAAAASTPTAPSMTSPAGRLPGTKLPTVARTHAPQKRAKIAPMVATAADQVAGTSPVLPAPGPPRPGPAHPPTEQSPLPARRPSAMPPPVVAQRAPAPADLAPSPSPPPAPSTAARRLDVPPRVMRGPVPASPASEPPTAPPAVPKRRAPAAQREQEPAPERSLGLKPASARGQPRQPLLRPAHGAGAALRDTRLRAADRPLKSDGAEDEPESAPDPATG